MSSQGASNSGGQGAGQNFVKFSRQSAQRIAKAVRIVEAGDRGQGGITFDHPMPGGGKVFRICTFTGQWDIGATKTVTFKYQTTTPNTASVSNLFWPIPDAGERDCSIAKEGTAWFLLVPRLYSGDAATAATITTAAIEFQTLPFVALASASTASFTIDIATCATSTTS